MYSKTKKKWPVVATFTRFTGHRKDAPVHENTDFPIIKPVWKRSGV